MSKTYNLYDSNGDRQIGGNLYANMPLIPTGIAGNIMTGTPIRAERLSPTLSEYIPGSAYMPSTPATTSVPLPSFPVGSSIPLAPYGPMSGLRFTPGMGPLVRSPYFPPGGMGSSSRPPILPIPPFVPTISVGPAPGSVFASGYIIVQNETKSSSSYDDYTVLLAKEFTDKTFLPGTFLSINVGRNYREKVGAFARTYEQSGTSAPIDNAKNAISHITNNAITRTGNNFNFEYDIDYNGGKVKIYSLLLNTPTSATHDSIIRFKLGDLHTCLASSSSCTAKDGKVYAVSSIVKNAINRLYTDFATPPAAASATPTPTAPGPMGLGTLVTL